MQSPITAKDIMSTNVLSVRPETTMFEAYSIIANNNFNGVPVVDEKNNLKGILTQYDLISKGSLIHLPTLQKILSSLTVSRQERSSYNTIIQTLSDLRVKDLMNSEPMTFSEDTSLEEIVKTFQEHHRVNPVPVLNSEKKLIGIISRFDVLRPLRLENSDTQ